MSEPSDLDAARSVLATLEAGRGALLAFASANLPFPNALAVHRAFAEGGVDLVAAEEAVTLRAELYWMAWRAAARGELVDEDAAPRTHAPPPAERTPAPRPAPERVVVPVAPPAPEPVVVPVAPPAPEAPPVAASRPEAPAPEPAEAPRSLFKKPMREVIQVDPSPPRLVAPHLDPFGTGARLEAERLEALRAEAARGAEAAAPPPADTPAAPPAMSGARPLDGQVGTATRVDPGHVRVIDPVTESPLLEDLARPAGEASGSTRPRLPELDKLPFEPISELDYVDDDASEVTQVASVTIPPLQPVGAPTPGEGRPRPDLIVDDFNEISELEELEPGEFGLPQGDPSRSFPPAPRSEAGALPISARRDEEDAEVLAQGDAPILPEFVAGNDDLSLSFEAGAGLLRAAPRLTDDEEPAQPAAAAPAGPRRDAVADQALIQKALSEAENAVARGDLTRAIQFYTDALDIGPGNVEAHIGRGRAHLELGDYSSAMSDFQRAEDLSPNDPESHLAMGDLYYNRKEYKRAIDFYDEAVELDGQHAMAKCKRGLAHYYRKNYKQAFTDLQRAMALDPNIPNLPKYVQMAMKKMDGRG